MAGSTADDGWGNAWTTTTAYTNMKGYEHIHMSEEVNPMLSNTGYDRKEYQFQVRGLEAHEVFGKCVSEIATKTIVAVYKPTFAITGIFLGTGGLGIEYTSTAQAGNTITISPIAGLTNRSYTLTNKPAVGNKANKQYLTILNKYFIGLPASGTTLKVSATLTNKDSIKVGSTVNKVLTYSAPTLAISQSVSANKTVRLDLSGGVGLGVYNAQIVYTQGDQKVVSLCIQQDTNTFIAFPPLGTDYTVQAQKLSTDEDVVFSYKSVAGQVVGGDSYCFDHKGVHFELGMTSSTDALIPLSSTNSGISVLVNGEEHERIYQDGATPQTLSIEGVVMQESDLTDFEKLGKGGYCVFRSNKGDILYLVYLLV